jgi:hypothetical protein
VKHIHPKPIEIEVADSKAPAADRVVAVAFIPFSQIASLFGVQ